MSNNKQSISIDFYRSRIIQITADGLNKRITGEQWDLLERKAYEQAKAMYENESFEIFKAGQDSMEEGGKGFDQWYQETSGGNNEY